MTDKSFVPQVASTLLLCSVFICGCSDKKGLPENKSEAPHGGSRRDNFQLRDQGYANDIERLESITDRLRKAGLVGPIVAFGEQGQATEQLIMVDYTLFDSLTDDGVAVTIAEAMVKRILSVDASGSEVNNPTSILQTDKIMQIDALVGRYVARSGFAEKGFAEWLERNQELFTEAQEPRVAHDLRSKAFIEAYMIEIREEQKR